MREGKRRETKGRKERREGDLDVLVERREGREAK